MNTIFKNLLLFVLIFFITVIVFQNIATGLDGLSSIILGMIFGAGTAFLVLFSINNHKVVAKTNNFLVLIFFLLASIYVFLIMPKLDRGLLILLDIYAYIMVAIVFIIYYLFYFLGKTKNNFINLINKIINIPVFIFLVLMGLYAIFYIIFI
jgi:hypothetical protein